MRDDSCRLSMYKEVPGLFSALRSLEPHMPHKSQDSSAGRQLPSFTLASLPSCLHLRILFGAQPKIRKNGIVFFKVFDTDMVLVYKT